MRTTNPLITILPAMPPGLREHKSTTASSRGLVLRVLISLLGLVALGTALMLGLDAGP